MTGRPPSDATSYPYKYHHAELKSSGPDDDTVPVLPVVLHRTQG